VVARVSTVLGFSYDIVEPEDGFYGVKQPDGSYNGVMGLFVEKRVDLLYTGLSISQDRASLIDFTQPFLQAGMDEDTTDGCGSRVCPNDAHPRLPFEMIPVTLPQLSAMRGHEMITVCIVTWQGCRS
jgi:ferredoxin